MPNFRRVFVENSYVFITVLLNNRKRELLTDYIDNLRTAFSHAQTIVVLKSMPYQLCQSIFM